MEDWDEIASGMYKEASSIDDHLGARLSNASVQLLTDRMRDLNALEVPAMAGSRVAFADNLGAVLSYPEPPVGGSEGTVVTVRTASGDVTHLDGLVFVKWDDGRFLPAHREHLRLAASQGSKKTAADLAEVNASQVGTLLVTADGHMAWRRVAPGKSGWEKQRPVATGDGWEPTRPSESGLHVFQSIVRMLGREKMKLVPPTYAMRVASLHDLSDFLKSAKDELIHKATKDLWNVTLVDGEYVIERLFDETGSPLKV